MLQSFSNFCFFTFLSSLFGSWWWVHKVSKCVYFFSFPLLVIPYKLCTPRMCMWWGGVGKCNFLLNTFWISATHRGYWSLSSPDCFNLGERTQRPLHKTLFWTLWMRRDHLAVSGIELPYVSHAVHSLVTTPIEQSSLYSSCHVHWFVFLILSSASNRV